jgi:hypothetical protein
MVRGRARAAGITTEVCNHSFRRTGITAYLENGGTLEKARQMAAHGSTRTTHLYDRREDRVTLDEGREDQYPRLIATASGAANFEEVNRVRLLFKCRLAVSLTAARR